MITARAPRCLWTPNRDGQGRSIREACEIARRWGVVIPEDVSFHSRPRREFGPDTYARTTRFEELAGTIVRWEWLYNTLTGKIPFMIREDVFGSDEAIVAVFGHEMFELEKLRAAFDSDHPIEHWEAETSPHYDHNFHCEAWDYADSLVEQMRAGGR